MALFNKILIDLKKNKQIKEQGGALGIPTPFPRFAEFVPMIERGQAIGLLSGTGTGKSKLSRYMYIYTPYKYYKETGYKIKIFAFCLEDSISKVYHHCICNYLFEQHGILISVQELNSKRSSLPDFVLEKLEEAIEYFSEFEQVVEFVTDIYTPKDIYNFLEGHAIRTGKVKTKTRVNSDGVEIKEYYYESDLHTLILLDNLSNLDTDAEDSAESERKAMIKMVRDYSRKRLVNFFNFTVVHIMQLDFQSERQQFTNTGLTILSKLEPSLAGIGEAKTVSRGLHLILGLFDPSRFELVTYPIPSRDDPENCYRIDILGNRFRALKILKNNDGETGKRIGLLFNPLAETWEELPPPKTELIKKIYASLANKNNFNQKNNKLTFGESEETPF